MVPICIEQLDATCSRHESECFARKIQMARRRNLTDIVADVVRELGDQTDKQLVLSEAHTHAAVMSSAKFVVGLDRVYKGERSREQLMAVSKYAEDLGSLLAQVESKLKHPLATALVMPDDADQRFFKELALMREVCRANMLARPNRGRSSDNVKRGCAAHAFHLMQHFSRRPITGSAESPFLVITQLLFEAATGEKEASCKRACDHTLRYHRRKVRITT